MTKNKKETKKQKQRKTRVPRPLGFTQIHRTQTKEQLQLKYIEHYVNNGLQLNKQHKSIQQLAYYIQLNELRVHKYINDMFRKIGKWMGDEKELREKARVIFQILAQKNLENMALHEAQVRLLEASQGGSYKPFISSTLNQALANLTAAQSPLLGTLKMITDKSPTNILITQNTTLNQNTSQTYITQEMALKMVRDNAQSMADNPASADAYYGTLNGVPDVNARTQDLRAIGIKHNGALDTLNTNPIALNEVPDDSEDGPNKHETRRAKTMGFEEIEDIEEFNA